MDQSMIGKILKELRIEKNLTQEQLAEKVGVTQRSISRWENGNTLPDISILIELSDFYEVDLREILSGERNTKNMNKDLKDTLLMIADYTDQEKTKILLKTYKSGIISAISFIIVMFIYAYNLISKSQIFDNLMFEMIITGVASSILTIIYSMQMSGKIGKMKSKKLKKISLIIAVLILVISLCLLLFIINS